MEVVKIAKKEDFMGALTDTVAELDKQGKLEDVKDKENNTITFGKTMAKLVENGYFVEISADELKDLLRSGKLNH